MKRFAELFAELDQTNKTGEKTEALRAYFAEAEDADKLWALALLSGRKPRQQVSGSLLQRWATAESGISEWLFRESYHVVGDLAETLSLLLPAPKERQEMHLAGLMEGLAGMAQMSEEEKRQFVTGLWDGMESGERLVLIKIITGSWRVGVSTNLVIRALSELTGEDVPTLSHRLMGNWTPETTTWTKLLAGDGEGDADASRPYPFFLAYPVEAVEELGEPGEWSAEWKWDGIRAQVIKRDGELFVWSRGEDLATAKFPELGPLGNLLPDGTVLDGELLPFWEGKPMAFAKLQTRLGRKNITKKLLQEVPVVVCAYDLLEWKGRDVRGEPLHWRRHVLEGLIQRVDSPLMTFSGSVPFASWEELAELRQMSREHYAEGFMLKRLSSTYQVGRRRGDWWKWKIEPYSIDGVLIYAQRGHGRRADLFTDYTFGVWEEGHLVPFAKAYSGLTDKEIAQVDAFVKRNAIDKFGPVRTVKPELVFEIGFEGIQESTRHKSGVALRFPRILRWRHDKQIEEASTLEELKALLPR